MLYLKSNVVKQTNKNKLEALTYSHCDTQRQAEIPGNRTKRKTLVMTDRHIHRERVTKYELEN